jgi:hypothetical protein
MFINFIKKVLNKNTHPKESKNKKFPSYPKDKEVLFFGA